MATSVGDIALNLKLDKKPYERGLADVKSSAGRIGSGIGKSLAVGIAGALGTVVATTGLKSLISQAMELGDTIDKTSQKMGMTIQSYQEWGYMMDICGTSIDSITMGIKTLAASAETGKDALAELGITQAELANMSQDELFARTVKGLQQVEDRTRRTYLAGQLLGRGATELGPLLNMTAEETEHLRQNLYNLGGAMSATAVQNSADLTDAITDIKYAFRSVSNTVAEYVLPIITSAINSYIIPAIQKACAVIRYFASLWNSVFGAIGKGASFLGKTFGKISSGFKSAFGKAQQKQNAKMAKSLGGVSKGVGGTGKSAKKAKKAVKELTRELMGFDKMNKLAKKNNASGAGGGAGGGGGGGAIGDLGDLEDALGGVDNKLFDLSGVTEKLAPLWKALGDIFKAVLRLIKALVKAFAPVGKFIWEHLIKPFGKLLGMAIIAVLEGIAGAIDLLASFIEKHPKVAVVLAGIGSALLVITKGAGVIGIVSKLGKVFGLFGAVLMAHPIIAIITGIALAIGYIYKNWGKIKKTKFGKVLISVGKVLKQIGAYIAGKFLKTFETAKKLVTGFKDAWAGIKSKTVELKAKAGEVAGDIWEGITDASATITVGLKDNFSSAWNGIKNVWAGIKSRTEAVTTKLSDYFSSAWNKIKSLWNGIKSKTATLTVNIKAVLVKGWNKLVKKLRGAKLPPIKAFGNKLPLLAQGGWVDKNTPQLAVVGDNKHEGEIVAPDSKLMAMARQASQEAVANSSNAQVVSLLTQLLATVKGIDTNVYLDGQDITRNTIKNINQQTRTTGKFPLVV